MRIGKWYFICVGIALAISIPICIILDMTTREAVMLGMFAGFVGAMVGIDLDKR